MARDWAMARAMVSSRARAWAWECVYVFLSAQTIFAGDQI